MVELRRYASSFLMSKHISFIHHFNVYISHVILPAIEKDYKKYDLQKLYNELASIAILYLLESSFMGSIILAVLGGILSVFFDVLFLFFPIICSFTFKRDWLPIAVIINLLLFACFFIDIKMNGLPTLLTGLPLFLHFGFGNLCFFSWAGVIGKSKTEEERRAEIEAKMEYDEN